MLWYEDLLDIQHQYEHLQDEVSRIIYKARLQYMIDHDEKKYAENILQIKKDWYLIDDFDNRGKPIIIYGAGNFGYATYRALNLCGYAVEFFCDSNPNNWGTKIGGGRHSVPSICRRTSGRVFYNYSKL